MGPTLWWEVGKLLRVRHRVYVRVLGLWWTQCCSLEPGDVGQVPLGKACLQKSPHGGGLGVRQGRGYLHCVC